MKAIEYNGKQIEYYDYYLSSSSCTFTFFNGDDVEIQDFFGSDIIPSVVVLDDETKRNDTIFLNMKVKSTRQEPGSIIRKHYSVVKASYYSEEPVIDMNTGNPITGSDGMPLTNTVFHPAEINTTTEEDSGTIITVILERPSIYDSVDSITKTVQQQTTSYTVTNTVAKIAAQAFTDDQALTVKDIYPTFNELASNKYTAKEIGYKFTYNSNLYKTAQANLTFQSHYVPGQGTESLYTHIDESHAGTIDDPIPAMANMEYFKGKYYIENGIKYLCNSELAKNGVVLQYVPSQLVGIYFSKVEGDS